MVCLDYKAATGGRGLGNEERHMGQWLRTSAWCVCCAASVLAPLAQLHGDETLHKRFLAEAPARWAKYRSLAAHLEGVVRMADVHVLDGKKTEKKGETRFAVDGPSAEYSEVRDGVLRWEIVNPRYACGVKSDKAGKWQLGYITFDRDEMDPTKSAREAGKSVVADYGGIRDIAMLHACHGMIIWVSWLPELVRSPGFRVIDIAEQKDNKDLVRVQYAYEPSQPNPNDYVRSGILVLDTSRYWLVQRAEFKCVFGGGTETGLAKETKEYDDTRMPFPVLKREVKHVSSTDGTRHAEADTVWTFDVRKPAPGQQQFTLSAFGLPEPAD
jgi:hypothetical protein